MFIQFAIELYNLKGVIQIKKDFFTRWVVLFRNKKVFDPLFWIILLENKNICYYISVNTE